jgi:hypothetical protein
MRERRHWLLLAGIVATTLAAVAVGIVVIGGSGEDPREPSDSPSDGPFFGVNDSLLYASAQSAQDDVSRAHAEAMAEAGIEWVRFSPAWRGEEANPPVGAQHVYDFQFLDRVVTVLAEQELPMSLALYTTPVWAADLENAEGCTANVNPRSQAFADFAAYAAEVTARYGSDGEFWAENPELPVAPLHGIEVWNEPNWNAFWCPTPEPEEYADMFVAAAKSVREVDPKVRLITGGLTSVFEDDVEAVAGGMDANLFIQRMMDRRPEIAKLADAIGFHPYAADVDGVIERIARFREGIDENGLRDVPIEINEAGWPTEGPAFPVAEPDRAALVEDLAAELWDSPCKVDGLALYAWRTPETTPGASELFYGIADPETAEPYETGTAYADQIAKLRNGPVPRGRGSCG